MSGTRGRTRVRELVGKLVEVRNARDAEGFFGPVESVNFRGLAAFTSLLFETGLEDGGVFAQPGLAGGEIPASAQQACRELEYDLGAMLGQHNAHVTLGEIVESAGTQSGRQWEVAGPARAPAHHPDHNWPAVVAENPVFLSVSITAGLNPRPDS
ncbi:MAG: hypothetical protein OXN89_18405 [Bryobacterales bacterium]|nr:hypothetical protein [Bryobacterales bacterium]